MTVKRMPVITIALLLLPLSTIWAQSAPSKTKIPAAVSAPSPDNIVITPAHARVMPGGTLNLAATVNGQSTPVAWTIQPDLGGHDKLSAASGPNTVFSIDPLPQGFCETGSVTVTATASDTSGAVMPTDGKATITIGCKADSEKTRPARSQDPANYMELIEDSGNNRILHFYPDAFYDHLRSRQFKVDAASTLLLRIVAERLDPSAALSNLLITAQLKHGSTSTNVEVKGYSVVGKNQSTGQSQNAVNLNSIANVRAQIENLYYTSREILRVVMPECLKAIEITAKPYFDSAVPSACRTSQIKDSQVPPVGPSQDTLNGLAAELHLFTPEINSLASLFNDPQNAFLGTYFSNDIFGMDLNSVKSVATEFQQAVADQTKQAVANQAAATKKQNPTANPPANAPVNPAANPPASAPAAESQAAPTSLDPNLWPRVVLIYEDLWTAINDHDGNCVAVTCISRSGATTQAVQADKTQPSSGLDPAVQAALVKQYLDGLTRKLIERLKEYLVDGQIVLGDYKAAAGDMLEITIEAQTPTAGNSSSGSILHFGITIDNFGVNAGPSTSLFFLKRIAVTAGDLSFTSPITPVTFAPAPGGSFGFTYHYRNYAKCNEPDRLTRDGETYPHPVSEARDDEKPQVEHVCSGNSKANSPGALSGTAVSQFDSFKDRHPNFMREPSGPGGKFLRALAPGLALNVSFMNWTLPGDYDVTSGKFSTSTAANIQVGAGFVVSLFDNMAQFTYGWNLQVTTRRDYWGLGFGFLEVGKTLGGLIKSKTSTPSQ